MGEAGERPAYDKDIVLLTKMCIGDGIPGSWVQMYSMKFHLYYHYFFLTNPHFACLRKFCVFIVEAVKIHDVSIH